MASTTSIPFWRVERQHQAARFRSLYLFPLRWINNFSLSLSKWHVDRSVYKKKKKSFFFLFLLEVDYQSTIYRRRFPKSAAPNTHYLGTVLQLYNACVGGSQPEQTYIIISFY